MKCFFIFVFVFVLLSQVCSQTDSLKQSFFFSLNEVNLPGTISRLDSVVQIDNGDSLFVVINGYADFIGSTLYNNELSQNRAEAVKNYLLEKTNPGLLQVKSCKGFGEVFSHDNRSASGEPYQRRVDVVYVKHKKPLKAGNPNLPANEVKRVRKSEDAAVPNVIVLPEKGKSIVIEGLLFIPGRHVWLPSSEAALAGLLKTLLENPEKKIEIQGHICCIEGSKDALDYDTNEKRLSENRAKAVYDYLVAKGIDAGRLRYKGYAHRNPKVSPELNSYDEQMNRRVEIKILDE